MTAALKSLLVVLLLPPVNLVFVILVGLAMLRRFPHVARYLIGIAALLLLVLAMPAVADTLRCSLEQNLPTTPPADKPPGAIVILGAEVRRTADTPPAETVAETVGGTVGEAAGETAGETVGPLTLERLRAGAALWRKTRLPVLVSGGLIPHQPLAIAGQMRQSLIEDFQVPVRWTENRSADTWQNARDSAAILHAAGIDSIYLVTHAWHERRALMAFAATGMAVTVAPTPLDAWPELRPSAFVPQVSSWQVSFYALHEWLGCVWYAL